jgi:hypothetical protein
VPTLALHGINGVSGGNYHLMDEESTGGMVMPPGIASSWTRNPPEEKDSAGNYQLIYADSDQNERKILRTVSIPGSAAPNPLCMPT